MGYLGLLWWNACTLSYCCDKFHVPLLDLQGLDFKAVPEDKLIQSGAAIPFDILLQSGLGVACNLDCFYVHRDLTIDS